MDDSERHLAELRRHLDAAGMLWDADAAALTRAELVAKHHDEYLTETWRLNDLRADWHRRCVDALLNGQPEPPEPEP